MIVVVKEPGRDPQMLEIDGGQMLAAISTLVGGPPTVAWTDEGVHGTRTQVFQLDPRDTSGLQFNVLAPEPAFRPVLGAIVFVKLEDGHVSMTAEEAEEVCVRIRGYSAAVDEMIARSPN